MGRVEVGWFAGGGGWSNIRPTSDPLPALVTELRQILADGASIRGIPVIRRSAVPLYVVFETVDRKQQQIAITATVNRDNGYMVQYRLGSGSGDPEVGAWHEIGKKYGNIIGFDVGATSVNMAVENLFNLARKKEKKEKEKKEKEKKEKKKIAFYQEMKRNLEILAVHLIESVRFCEIQKYISSGLTTKTTGSDTIGSDTSGSETSGSDTTGSDTIGSDTSESDTNRGPIVITEQISELIRSWGQLSESYIDGKSIDSSKKGQKCGITDTTMPQVVGLLKAKKGTN